ncbi:unnamed protein product [Prunus armeniaca]
MSPLLVLHSTFLPCVVPTTLTLSIEVFLPLVVCFRHRLPILPQNFLLLHNLVRKGFMAPFFSKFEPRGGNSILGGSSSFNFAGFSSDPVLMCQFYNKKCHAANTCRKLGRLLNASGSSPSCGPFTGYYANPQSAASTSSWIVDFGAIAHVTAANQHLQNSSPYTGSDSLQVGNVSSRQLLSLTLYPDSFTIKDLATKMMLFQGLSEDGVYRLPVGTAASFSSSPSTAFLIVNGNHLPISGDLSKSLICSDYMVGLVHKLPFVSSTHKSTKPLELVHPDVWGPSLTEPILPSLPSQDYVVPSSSNRHPMVTRSKNGIFKPKVLFASKHPIPTSVQSTALIPPTPDQFTIFIEL